MNVFADELQVALLARPGSWIYSSLLKDEPQGAADNNALGEVRPSVSETTLGYVSGGLLGRTGCFHYSEIDSEDESSPDRPCWTHIWISKYPQFPCVIGFSPGDPEFPTSPSRISLGQSNDPELGLILDGLEGEL